MPRELPISLHCPICERIVKSHDQAFPFCSDRCRIIDLGRWATGAYVISSPVTDAEEPLRDRNPEDEESDE
ncbi:MAG TPA: DNA gyrase inhibitor YacG [Candidatus Sulfotelmatobacter sp.]|jgi:uncharacterized protein|nr:DNA gyrase inhibitor YacG [Candidatus Sulfotelmatobacter sp.]